MGQDENSQGVTDIVKGTHERVSCTIDHKISPSTADRLIPNYSMFWRFAIRNDLDGLFSSSPTADTLRVAITKTIKEKLQSLHSSSDMRIDQEGFAAFLRTVRSLAGSPESLDQATLNEKLNGISDMHLMGLGAMAAALKADNARLMSKGGNLAGLPDMASKIISAYESRRIPAVDSDAFELQDTASELVMSCLQPVLNEAEVIITRSGDEEGASGWQRVVSAGRWQEELKSRCREALYQLCWLNEYHSFVASQGSTGRSDKIQFDEMLESVPHLLEEWEELQAHMESAAKPQAVTAGEPNAMNVHGTVFQRNRTGETQRKWRLIGQLIDRAGL